MSKNKKVIILTIFILSICCLIASLLVVIFFVFPNPPEIPQELESEERISRFINTVEIQMNTFGGVMTATITDANGELKNEIRIDFVNDVVNVVNPESEYYYFDDNIYYSYYEEGEWFEEDLGVPTVRLNSFINNIIDSIKDSEYQSVAACPNYTTFECYHFVSNVNGQDMYLDPFYFYPVYIADQADDSYTAFEFMSGESIEIPTEIINNIGNSEDELEITDKAIQQLIRFDGTVTVRGENLDGTEKFLNVIDFKNKITYDAGYGTNPELYIVDDIVYQSSDGINWITYDTLPSRNLANNSFVGFLDEYNYKEQTTCPNDESLQCHLLISAFDSNIYIEVLQGRIVYIDESDERVFYEYEENVSIKIPQEIIDNATPQ